MGDRLLATSGDHSGDATVTSTVHCPLSTDHCFIMLQSRSRSMSVPVWVQDSVFYQIFPDRFANGDPANDPPAVQPWGSPPTITGFQGGDLRGIVEHFDYLTDLGVTALYLNPIFAAGSNHRYNTSDYHAIDDRLGTLGDFTRLVEQAHGRGQ